MVCAGMLWVPWCCRSGPWYNWWNSDSSKASGRNISWGRGAMGTQYMSRWRLPYLASWVQPSVAPDAAFSPRWWDHGSASYSTCNKMEHEYTCESGNGYSAVGMPRPQAGKQQQHTPALWQRPGMSEAPKAAGRSCATAPCDCTDQAVGSPPRCDQRQGHPAECLQAGRGMPRKGTIRDTSQ